MEPVPWIDPEELCPKPAEADNPWLKRSFDSAYFLAHGNAITELFGLKVH